MSTKNDLVCVWVVQIDLILVWGTNLTRFQCSDELDLVVVWVVQNDLFFERVATITCS